MVPDPPARPGRSRKTCVGFMGIQSAEAKLEGFGFLLGGARKLVNLTFGPFSIAMLDYRSVMRLCNSDGNTQPQEFVATVELSKRENWPNLCCWAGRQRVHQEIITK